MLETIEKLFRAWSEASICYCHWKSTNHLAKTMAGQTDIDVLVDRGSFRIAEKCLTDCNFLRMDTVGFRSYPGVQDYVCLDDSGSWVHVHLHYQLVLGDRWAKAYWLPVEENVLKGAYWNKEYSTYVVHPQHEMWLLGVRMSLKHWRPFSKESVLREVDHIRGDLRRVERTSNLRLAGQLALDSMSDFLEKKRPPTSRKLNRLASKVRSELSIFRRYSWIGYLSVSLSRQLFRYWVEFNRRILKRYGFGRRRIPRGGVSVAVVGIDGSGKTTIVRQLEQKFAVQMNVERVFLGNGRSGASYYRKAVFSVFGARAKLRRHREYRDNVRSNRSEHVPWYYALWVLLCVWDKEKNLRRAMAAKANGCLVLSDRWPQSQSAETIDGPRLCDKPALRGLARYVAKREERFHGRAKMFKPDLVVKLVVDPSNATARKPGEFTLDEAQADGMVLKDLTWDGSVVVEVDGNQSAFEVKGQVERVVWQQVAGLAG